MLTTIVLFQGLSAPPTQIITLVMGFLVICFGITILQLSKIDPTELRLDRRSTILLQAAQRETAGMDEKSITAVEDPGIDALRGTFGMVGSVIRARSARRMSMSSKGSARSSGRWSNAPPLPGQGGDPLAGLKRHQLWDAPMPPSRSPSMADVSTAGTALDERSSVFSGSHLSSVGAVVGTPVPRERKQTIKFDKEDVVHSYHVPGSGDNSATHERRGASHYPTIPPSTPTSKTVRRPDDWCVQGTDGWL